MSKPQQHSPGPFTYDDIRRSIINALGLPICEMTQYEWDGDRALFIAAPDMLRLLRVLVRTCDSDMDGRQSWLVLNDALDEANKLITRLDGGE